jgi:hypothetical protein
METQAPKHRGHPPLSTYKATQTTLEAIAQAGSSFAHEFLVGKVVGFFEKML